MAKLPSKILCDTNFLLIPIRFGVDVFILADKVLSDKSMFYVSSKVIDEINLLKISAKPKFKKELEFALKMADKCKIIEDHSEITIDDSLIQLAKKNDMVIGIGPAGTGKTYLAMAMAINALLKKQVSRIILARPAVEAGEKLGFLPGDLSEKINPYLRPLYDALFDMMEAEKAYHLIDKGIIEIAPLAFMRGRTLNDSFIILDEAQNTTSEQMKMYLTRLGFNSKTVITGDITQVDLPFGKMSGLVEAERLLKGISGLCFIYFSDRDVVRHKLVQKIIKAYERFEKSRSISHEKEKTD